MKTPKLSSNVKRCSRCVAVEKKRFRTIYVVCDSLRLCDDDATDFTGDEPVAKERTEEQDDIFGEKEPITTKLFYRFNNVFRNQVQWSFDNPKNMRGGPNDCQINENVRLAKEAREGIKSTFR